MLNDRFLICKKKTCSTCILHFGTSAKQQCEINSKFYGERRHGCVLSFLYLNLSTGVTDSLKFTFPGGIFVGVSDKIQCLFFFRRLRKTAESIQRLFKLASFARLLPSFLIILLFHWNCVYRTEVTNFNCRNRNITGSSLGRRDLFASIRKRKVNLNTRGNTICHESVCFFEVLDDQTPGTLRFKSIKSPCKLPLQLRKN